MLRYLVLAKKLGQLLKLRTNGVETGNAQSISLQVERGFVDRVYYIVRDVPIRTNDKRPLGYPK